MTEVMAFETILLPGVKAFYEITCSEPTLSERTIKATFTIMWWKDSFNLSTNLLEGERFQSVGL